MNRVSELTAMNGLLAACVLLVAGCATPPKSDPSRVDSGCAQSCSANLATCSSGFKMFPIVQQKQCNDTYDVCIKGCPARQSQADTTSTKRLKELSDLLQSGAITQAEYEAKRRAILDAL